MSFCEFRNIADTSAWGVGNRPFGTAPQFFSVEVGRDVTSAWRLLHERVSSPLEALVWLYVRQPKVMVERTSLSPLSTINQGSILRRGSSATFMPISLRSRCAETSCTALGPPTRISVLGAGEPWSGNGRLRTYRPKRQFLPKS